MCELGQDSVSRLDRRTWPPAELPPRSSPKPQRSHCPAVTRDLHSLCVSCAFARVVRGRRDQRYLLCRNDAVPERYPRQPVLVCSGYETRSQRSDDPGDSRS